MRAPLVERAPRLRGALVLNLRPPRGNLAGAGGRKRGAGTSTKLATTHQPARQPTRENAPSRDEHRPPARREPRPRVSNIEERGARLAEGGPPHLVGPRADRAPAPGARPGGAEEQSAGNKGANNKHSPATATAGQRTRARARRRQGGLRGAAEALFRALF